MIKIILLTNGEDGRSGHLIGANETPAEAALRIAHGRDLSGNQFKAMTEGMDSIAVLVATADPLAFEIEPIADEARVPISDDEGEFVSETYDLARHPGAISII